MKVRGERKGGLEVDVTWSENDEKSLDKTLEPKSPVQKRLEKRNRSPGMKASTSRSLSSFWDDQASPVNMAKKRREEMLEAQALENGRRVARAKEIARMTSEERQRETAQLADRIEDKLRAAESRREEILNDRRLRASPRSPLSRRARRRSIEIQNFEAKIQEAEERRNGEFEKRMEQVRHHLQRVKERCDQVRMVRRLQSWWRLSANKKKVALAFLRTKPGESLKVIFAPMTQPDDQEESGDSKEANVLFETLANHLNEQHVIMAAQAFLDSLKRGSGSKSPRAQSTVSAARSFLATLMIYHQPETVLGSTHSDAKRESFRRRLLIAAQNLYKNTFALLSLVSKNDKVSSSSSSSSHSWVHYSRMCSRLRLIRAAHLAYSRAFLTWKEADAICISDELMEAYVQIKLNLDDIDGMVKENPHDPGLQQHLAGNRGQLQMIELKVRKLLGETRFKTWTERANARVQTALADKNKDAQATDSAQQSATDAQNNKPALKEEKKKLPRPPKSLVQIPNNEQMVHELMLNPDFSLSVEEYELNLAGQELDAEEFTQLLEQGEFGILLALVETICNRLSALTPNRKDLVQQLQARLDTVLLRQQLEAGVFDKGDLYQLVQFIGERILALQAPARQEQTEGWLMELHVASTSKSADWKKLAPSAFDNILRELGYIDIDMANFHLRVLSSHLKDGKGIDYLRAKFEERVAQGEYQRNEHGVPAMVEAWIGRSHEAASSSLSVSNPPLHDCVIEGFVHVLFDSNVDSEAKMGRLLPETLRELDSARLFQFNRAIFKFSTLAVLNIILHQVLRVGEKLILSKTDIATQSASRSLMDLVHSVVQDGCTGEFDYQQVRDAMMAIAEEIVRIKRDGAAPSETTKVMLSSLLKQASEGKLSNTVRRQFESVLRRTLKAPDSMCDQLLKKIGLENWQQEITVLCKDIHAVYELNMKVHILQYQTAYAQACNPTRL